MLKVGIISISVLIISVGKLGILVAVWNPTEGCVVIKAGGEDLIHHFLCLFSADLPHSQDRAQGTSPDTLLAKQGKAETNEPNSTVMRTKDLRHQPSMIIWLPSPSPLGPIQILLLRTNLHWPKQRYTSHRLSATW